jgi:hypothetical protein
LNNCYCTVDEKREANNDFGQFPRLVVITKYFDVLFFDLIREQGFFFVCHYFVLTVSSFHNPVPDVAKKENVMQIIGDILFAIVTVSTRCVELSSPCTGKK